MMYESSKLEARSALGLPFRGLRGRVGLMTEIG